MCADASDPHGHDEPSRPSSRSFVSNWAEYEGSFATKLRLASRNLLKPTRVVKGCCGHPGEPGC